MKHVKTFFFLLLLILGCSLISCSNEADKLEGSWSTTIGLGDDYSEFRIYQQSKRRFTYFHTFNFIKEKDKNGGYFLDIISPIVFSQSPYDIVVGSEVNGKWEIIKGKLYLKFFDNIELINAENLNLNDQNYLASQMQKNFLDKYKKVSSQGLNFEIKDTKDGSHLIIYFGNVTESFTKREI